MHPEAIYHRLLSENTEFTFPEGTEAWYTPWAQGSYELRPLEDWEDACERPVTLRVADDL